MIKNVKTDAATIVNVKMIDGCGKRHIGGLEGKGKPFWNLYLDGKDAFCINNSFGNLDSRKIHRPLIGWQAMRHELQINKTIEREGIEMPEGGSVARDLGVESGEFVFRREASCGRLSEADAF
ncbi:hypothetical protein ACLOJK_019009 [Asimina triloba]